MAAAVIVVLVLFLVMVSGSGRKNAGAADPDMPNGISEADGSAPQEDTESEAAGDNREDLTAVNGRSAEEGAAGDSSGGSPSGGDGSGSGGNGSGAQTAGSHKTTSEEEYQGTVLPGEPLKPTKVEDPGNKPDESQGGNPSGTPDEDPSSQTGTTTPTESGGEGAGNPSQGGSDNKEGVELPIILFD